MLYSCSLKLLVCCSVCDMLPFSLLREREDPKWCDCIRNLQLYGLEMGLSKKPPAILLVSLLPWLALACCAA